MRRERYRIFFERITLHYILIYVTYDGRTIGVDPKKSENSEPQTERFHLGVFIILYYYIHQQQQDTHTCLKASTRIPRIYARLITGYVRGSTEGLWNKMVIRSYALLSRAGFCQYLVDGEKTRTFIRQYACVCVFIRILQAGSL